MNFANMEVHRRMIWLLLLALFQPSFTGAACNVTEKLEDYEYQERYYYYVQCALTSLQMNVPLTTYLSGYDYEVIYVRSIDFRSSTINTVPAGVFQAFSAVELLNMDNVSINNIESGALRGLTKLEELKLSHNNISDIQDGTFDGLVQLKKLYMVGNKITTLKSLNGLANLQLLYVNGNNIATIGDSAFQITTSMKIVDLSNNAIRSVPCSELSGRVTLYLNQITSLVNCSKHISYLDVSYNQLTSVPAMLFKGSPSKISLDLSHNNISSVHADAFEELRHLVTLTMNNNRISSIPAGTFRHLGELTTLDISFNKLTHLEFGFFGGLTSLQELDVADNNIAMLESKVLFPLTSLTYLNLDGNLLHTFDVDTMVSHLGTLKSISLNRNQIRCELLTSYIYKFRLRNIKIITGDSFKTKNVHGIYCISDDAPQYSTIPTDVTVKVTQPLLPTKKLTGKSVTPTAAVVPTQATPSTTTRIPSTTVFPFTKAPELVDVSTGHLMHTQTMEDHNDHAVIDSNVAEASRTENEKINVLLKVNSNMHFLLVFTTVAVIILIILNLLLNMYFIKRNNIDNGRNSSSSCSVELVKVTD